MITNSHSPQRSDWLSTSNIVAWLAPTKTTRYTWLEVAVITLGTLWAAAQTSPKDPLWLDSAFPWLWLAPTLIALRYGSMAAFSAAALFFVDWFLLQHNGLIPIDFPGQYFLGGLLLTLMAGEFADVWSARLKQVNEINDYLNQRLVSLTRNHYLLRFSHERLEQDLLTRPVTLRDSLLHLRHLTVDAGEATGNLPAVQELMRILAQTCQLEVASLHQQIHGRITAAPSASLGEASALDVRDPLVIHALQYKELCHVQTSELDGVKSRYLVASPLINSEGQCVGLLVIERMPFLSLNAECLQFISVTLGYYADTISQAPAVRELQRHLPGCPMQFAGELLRLERVYRECRIDSTIVALIFDAGLHHKHLLEEAEQHQQQLEVTWVIQGPGPHILLTLMPLHSTGTIKGYLASIEQRFQAQFGAPNQSKAKIRYRTARISEQPAAELMTGLLESCHVA